MIERAERVLACLGFAPVRLRCLSELEIQRVAELLRPDNTLVADAREKYRLIMVEHYESQKATDEETDTLPISEQNDGIYEHLS